MNAQRLGTLIRLDLTQRTRSVAWYVLLSVFALHWQFLILKREQSRFETEMWR